MAAALRELIGRLPEHPGILPILDAGVVDNRPFIVTPQVTGDPLDAALHIYGPAALADALPRLQQLADALDLAAARDLCHGTLTPADVFVTAEDTCVVGLGVSQTLLRQSVAVPLAAPYTAPEVAAGGQPTPRSDQYALAVIAYEWLFGRGFDGAPLGDVTLAGVDMQALSRAFAVATAVDPAHRFANCTELVAAIGNSATGAEVEEPARVLTFAPATEEELPLNAGSDVAVTVTRTDDRNLRPVAVAAMLIAGLAVGALVMWMMAAGSRPSDTTAQGAAIQTDTPATPAADQRPREVTEAAINPPRDDMAPPRPAAAPPVVRVPVVTQGATRAAPVEAGLLVHSMPAGATVTIDGVPRGTTPVAVRSLGLGTRTVVIRRPGYQVVERQVVLTGDRPSRTLEVELTPLRAAAPTSAAARPAEGTVVIDSRPTGASVVIDGRAVGVTPMTIALLPGAHTVRLERAGYRAVTTRVDVKAGERTRVAARLEGGQDEE